MATPPPMFCHSLLRGPLEIFGCNNSRRFNFPLPKCNRIFFIILLKRNHPADHFDGCVVSCINIGCRKVNVVASSVALVAQPNLSKFGQSPLPKSWSSQCLTASFSNQLMDTTKTQLESESPFNSTVALDQTGNFGIDNSHPSIEVIDACKSPGPAMAKPPNATEP